MTFRGVDSIHIVEQSHWQGHRPTAFRGKGWWEPLMLEWNIFADKTHFCQRFVFFLLSSLCIMSSKRARESLKKMTFSGKWEQWQGHWPTAFRRKAEWELLLEWNILRDKTRIFLERHAFPLVSLFKREGLKEMAFSGEQEQWQGHRPTTIRRKAEWELSQGWNMLWD